MYFSFALLFDHLKDVNGKDSRGFTPLHYACNIGSRECVEQLLGARADPNTVCSFYYPPCFALRCSLLRLPRVFISLTLEFVPCVSLSRPFQLTPGGLSPLMLACRAGSADAISAMLDEEGGVF